MEIAALVAWLMKMGAPWAMTAVMLYLFFIERKRKDELADKLFDLGMASVRKDIEIHSVLRIVQKDVDEIRRAQK